MQYLTDAEGNHVGIFLSMTEWKTIRGVLVLADESQEDGYDAWFREKVEAGLRDVEQGRLFPLSQTIAKLKAHGINVDSTH